MRNWMSGFQGISPRGLRLSKAWIISRHEIQVQFRRVSFWIGFALPLLGYLVYGGATLLNQREAQTNSEEDVMITPQNLFQPNEKGQPLGYVDFAGLVHQFPETVEPGSLISFDSESKARKAMQMNEIRGYYIINDDFLDGDLLLYYTNELSFTNLLSVDAAFKEVLVFNMLDGNRVLFHRVMNPIASIDETILVPENASIYKSEDTYSLLIPVYGLMFFMIAILGSSSLMLNSFNRETETRVMEILLCSANAREIMWGKFAAYWLIGLISILFWMANLAVFTWLTGDALASLVPVNLSGKLMFWATVNGLLGYLLYSTLMMGLGTLVPYLREVSRVSQVLMFVVLIPTLFATIFAEDPNGVLAVVMSFFPLTAPTAVTLRIMFGIVPTWQIALSSLMMIVSTALSINLIARYYQPYHILSEPQHKIFADLRSILKRFSFRRRAEVTSPAD